ncbi:MAG: hypothetical protein Alis3KO_41470 [Aliiglaciecola sp.]
MDTNSAKLKSQMTQALLILPFGPIGLIYSNWQMATLLTFIAVAFAGAFFFMVILLWPLSWAAGFYTVKRHNVLAHQFISLRKRQENAGI